MDSFADIKEISAYWGNPWIQSFGIVILSLVLTVALRWTLRFILSPLVHKTRTEVDDIIMRTIKKTVTYLIPLIGLMVALRPFSSHTPIPQRALFSLLAVLLMRSATGLVEELSQWLKKTWVNQTQSNWDDALLPLMAKALKTVVVIVGVLLILQQWDIQIGPMLRLSWV